MSHFISKYVCSNIIHNCYRILFDLRNGILMLEIKKKMIYNQ